MATFRVLRQHFGDRQYLAGEIREMTVADAKQLVDLGTLERVAADAGETRGSKDEAGAGAKRSRRG